MNSETFFEEPLEQSLVKARIVANYFSAWSRVMLNIKASKPLEQIGFFDLFAGAGAYADGSPSTPLRILQETILRPELAKSVVTFFNDKEQDNIQKLSSSVMALSGIMNLKHPPKFSCEEVAGSEFCDLFPREERFPAILFLDPWGYKGVTLKLVHSIIKDWGSECIFFLNYLRINPAFDNPRFATHVDDLFGASRANNMRGQLKECRTPHEREIYIMDQLVAALEGNEANYVLKFRFVSSKKDRTSHYLVFATKGFLGYEIMKDIMAKESIPHDSVVPTFEFIENPDLTMPLNLENPNETLALSLVTKFSGKTLSFDAIYKNHSPKTNFVKNNYKSALSMLEASGKIQVSTLEGKKRRTGTFGENCRIFFVETNNYV